MTMHVHVLRAYPDAKPPLPKPPLPWYDTVRIEAEGTASVPGAQVPLLKQVE